MNKQTFFLLILQKNKQVNTLEYNFRINKQKKGISNMLKHSI